MALSKIQRVVFHEHRAVIVRHDLEQPGKRRMFPIPLCAKPIPIAHEELHGEAGKLLQAFQILEIRTERFVSLIRKECLQSKVETKLIAYRFFKHLWRIVLRRKRIVLAQLLVRHIDILFIDRIDDIGKLADRPIVDRPP